MIESAQYQNAEQTSVSVVMGGKTLSVPTSRGNRDFEELLEWVHQPDEQWYQDWRDYNNAVSDYRRWEEAGQEGSEPVIPPKPLDITELPVVNSISPYVAPVVRITSIEPEEFFDRFTEAEQDAIIDATYTDKQVKKFYDRMIMQRTVELESQKLENGMSYLVSAGLITESRKAEIMTVGEA